MSKNRSASNRDTYGYQGDYLTGKSFYRVRQIPVLSIADQGDDVFRYTLATGANIEDLFLNGTAVFVGCDNALNNAELLIDTINRSTPYVDVVNPAGVAQVTAGGFLSLDEKGRALNVNIDPRTQTVSVMGRYNIIIDDTGIGGITYISFGEPGMAKGDPGWAIMRIYESGTITEIAWADDTSTLIKVHDDRASYTYTIS